MYKNPVKIYIEQFELRQLKPKVCQEKAVVTNICVRFCYLRKLVAISILTAIKSRLSPSWSTKNVTRVHFLTFS